MVNFSWKRDLLRRTNQRGNRNGKSKSRNQTLQAGDYRCNYLRSRAISGERQETESQALDSIHDSVIERETAAHTSIDCMIPVSCNAGIPQYFQQKSIMQLY